MPTKAPKTPYAIHPKAHRLRVRHFIDQDYLKSLSHEEQVWLGQFLDAHYDGIFSTPVGRQFTPDQRREVYRDDHHNEMDASQRLATRHMSREDDRDDELDCADPSPDGEPTPEYLNHPRYKRALAAWRNEPDVESTARPGVAARKFPSRRKLILKTELDAIVRLGIAGLLEDEG